MIVFICTEVSIQDGEATFDQEVLTSKQSAIDWMVSKLTEAGERWSTREIRSVRTWDTGAPDWDPWTFVDHNDDGDTAYHICAIEI